MSWPPVLLASIEMLINRYLGLDPELLTKLSQLKGKIIAIEITDLQKNLYFFPHAKGMLLQGNYSGDADTFIHTSSISLLQLADTQRKQVLLRNAQVRITGDIALGEQFQSILHSIEIDWAGYFALLSGDIISHKLSRFTQHLQQWGKNNARQLQENTAEYLLFEKRTLVPPQELQSFFDNVDTLRSDLDRLSARVMRLQLLTPAIKND